MFDRMIFWREDVRHKLKSTIPTSEKNIFRKNASKIWLLKNINYFLSVYLLTSLLANSALEKGSGLRLKESLCLGIDLRGSMLRSFELFLRLEISSRNNLLIGSYLLCLLRWLKRADKSLIVGKYI